LKDPGKKDAFAILFVRNEAVEPTEDIWNELEKEGFNDVNDDTERS